MLIDKGASVGEVVTFKLTSGEELIGKLIEETDVYYKLSRPMVIAMGAQGPGLMPYLFTVSPDKDIKLSKSTVTVVAVTDKMFADQFIQSTTGIKLVSIAGSIIDKNGTTCQQYKDKVIQTQKAAQPHRELPRYELMASPLWLMVQAYRLMRHGSQHEHTHHTLPQALLVVVAQYVLVENLLLELAMLTPADMHEQAAVPM